MPDEFLPIKKHVRCNKCGRANTVWSDSQPETQVCGSCGAGLSIFRPEAGEYAGFWIRLGAGILDIIIVSFISFITLVALVAVFPPETNDDRIPFLSLLSLPLYYWLFTALNSRTPGKKLFNIKVVDTDGNKPGLGRAALREVFGKLISTVALFIGFLFITIDRQKQAWHDKIAGTYVLKARKRA